MKSVLVTGASSGIGAATVTQLAAGGMRVFAAVRDPADGQAIAAHGSGDIEPVVLDVTDDASVAAAAAQVTSSVGPEGLWGLVNNAGDGFPGPLEIMPFEQLEQQLDVNLLGQIRVTRAFLPLLRAARGRIVFVGSIGGKVALEFAGAYHASKFAIEAVADVWRQELRPDGVAVALIEPGPMSTGIWSNGVERLDGMIADPSPAMDRYRDRLTSFRQSLVAGDEHGGSPESVAAVIEKALTSSRPGTRYPVGLSAKVTSALGPFVPDRLFDLVGRRLGG